MLLVFVNKERDKVLYATYDEDSAKHFYKHKRIRLAACAVLYSNLLT